MMIPIIVILFGIFIADYIFTRLLVKKSLIKDPALYSKYVNKFHQYGENTLYFILILIVVIGLHDYHPLRVFIFIVLSISACFQALMEWTKRKETKLYILSLITAGLALIGEFIYVLWYSIFS